VVLRRQRAADVGSEAIFRLDFQQEQAMESQKPSVSPLRQRMLDDVRMRKFGQKTQLD
jgi:hypothetical protein